MTDKDFGKRLRDAMEAARVRVEDVARVAGVHPKRVSQWRGGEIPHETQLAAIAVLVGRSLPYLRYGVETAADADAVRRGADANTRLVLAARLRELAAQLEREAGADQPTTPGRFPKSRTKLLPDRRGQQPAGDHDTNRNGDGGESAAGGS